MKQKMVITILWMVIFAAVAFCIIPVTFIAILFSQLISDEVLRYVLWSLRSIFVASPFIALFLGLRGRLPGTEPPTDAKRSSNKTTKILSFVVVVIGVFFAIGAWVALQPAPGRPDVSIGFFGYTNDPTGARIANIAVTNLSAATVLAYQPKIEIQATWDSRGYENYLSGVNSLWRSRLDAGASDNFTIAPPANQSSWRLSIYVYPDRGRTVRNKIKRVDRG